jgi:hypothetical protein
MSPEPAIASVDCKPRPRPRKSDGTDRRARPLRTTSSTDNGTDFRGNGTDSTDNDTDFRGNRTDRTDNDTGFRGNGTDFPRLDERTPFCRSTARRPTCSRCARTTPTGVGYSRGTGTVLRGYSSGIPWACMRRTHGVLDGVLTVLTAGGGGARATAGRRRAVVGGGGEGPDLQERIRLCGIIQRCNHDATATTTMQPMQTRRCNSVASDATAACPVFVTVASSPSLSFTLRRPVITQRR